ncbi:MAG: class I SAM-dependent RNA methyltransferase [Eubacteriales bacterium]|nr:class I SAM-dependent RNA methyltransferase [Eubacteriales bacterium]
MKTFEIIATSAFGIESVTAREISELGYKDILTENGRVTFRGDFDDIARANVCLRTADRILIKLAQFKATTFEELFQGVYAVEWADILSPDAFIHVVGKSVKSTLFSVPDCQSITKKAIIEKLKLKFGKEIFPEDGAEYRISVSILKDIVTVTLDTSGAGLHKRGYRSLAGEAPLKETLACSLLLLSYWRGERLLVDPLCGSGTIPIEAAMIALDIAPGMNRGFAAERWQNFDYDAFERARDEAKQRVRTDLNLNIYGSDIDPKAIELAMRHAEEAGVDEYIRLKQMNVADLASKEKYGFIVTNPPYGERLGESREAEELYRVMGKAFSALDTWSFYVITSNPYFEKNFGRKADKRRKLYNGKLECQYYQYFGPKPPKKEITVPSETDT